MILCERATQTVNLYYSVIKFLKFEGIVWSGDSLPLKLSSLGEIYNTKITVTDQNGAKVPQVTYDRGYLWAQFQNGNTYTIDMRLEYGIPTTVQEYTSDFVSIHPKSYMVALDFSANTPMGKVNEVCLRLGESTATLPVAESNERRLESGHHMRLVRERDYCSFTATMESHLPYAHRHFPVLSVA